MSGRFCIDTSAWHRRNLPSLASRLADLIEVDLVSISEQARLEILFSARTADDYTAISAELAALSDSESGEAVWRRAAEVQRALAQVGGLHHRSVKIADLVIAASAELSGDTVLHYDADFDRIAEITGQPTEWIAQCGSI